MNLTTAESIKKLLVQKVLLGHEPPATPEILKELSFLGKERIHRPLIYVGMASCGTIAGASKIHDSIKEYLEGYNYQVDLVEGGCIGLCSMEPIVDIQMPGRTRLVFGNVSKDKVSLLLDEMLNYSLPQGVDILGQYSSQILQNWDDVPDISAHPFFAGQHRLLLKHCGVIDPLSVAEYIAKGGYRAFSRAIAQKMPVEVCQCIEESRLTGRGGGNFPVGRKWRMVQETYASQKYFIANAVESDPGSYMNRMVMESNPHLLIESLLIGAYATAASKAILFTRREFDHAAKQFEKALEQARNFGLVGHNILDSGVSIDISIKKGARAFVCGEETALINSIEGKRAMPQAKPPYPTEKGLWDKPTCVNNVETLINVPLILHKGAEWFKGIGTETSKGTKLFTLSGQTSNRGIIEVTMGATFREIIYGIGGGLKNSVRFKALLLGINSGNFITENTLDVRIDYKELQNIGISLGSGGFAVVDQTTCMVDIAAHLTKFFQKESCGKCIPCREGTAIISQILEQTIRRPDAGNKTSALERFKGIMQLKSVSTVIRETSLCALGRSAPNAILSVMQNFNDELRSHIYDRKCPSGSCKGLRVFFIDPNKCIGCTVCFKKCPSDAIVGTIKQPHHIIDERCIGCSVCYDSCKFNAISAY
ncbi:MAG TPA: NADH-quinone oxidoreductase subunit F [Bacteroidales bacterium]|nr:NADH-quinone oxidoreductase subunit F [Bacteroidales bacterium]